MKFQSPILLFLIALLVACSSKIHMNSPQALDYESDAISFRFRAPEGYCLERPSLREVQGPLNAEHQFLQIIASNCEIIDGAAKPSALENILTMSVGMAQKPIEDEIKEIAEISNQEIKTEAGQYWLKNKNGGIGLIFQLNGKLVYLDLIPVIHKDEIAHKKLLEASFQALKKANETEL